ncbi:peptidoglycan editing factor PgeF [Clostridium sp. YIM B02555]|uniref:peptidoglycan editing factor PgeF n=1 Tax=Clostridium sp. YIM B02555 TaxID=2911968 RepID=UPI001EEEDD78
MNTLELKELYIKEDFAILDNDKSIVAFTNAEKERSFNRNTEDGVSEINSLKKEFAADDVIYLKQIHSDKILKYENNASYIKNEEGDAIITNQKNIIIGVFTADCVPIILVDEVDGVMAAIHSGWRGTFESITLKTIRKMKAEFNIKVDNLRAYIGPHIRKCCYEVSEDLKKDFINKKSTIREEDLFEGRNLNLEACILEDLKEAGVKACNINSLNLCTYCSDEIKLHSYRKSNGTYGRMFSFAMLR